MSNSIAIPAFGTFLKRGDGGSPTEEFTTIAEVKSATWTMSAKMEDVTTHSSAVPYRQFLSTLIDPGTITFDINFVPTEATQDFSAGLFADFNNRSRRNFKWVFPDQGSTTWALSAYVQDFKPSAPVDGVLSASVTLKISGQPTFA